MCRSSPDKPGRSSGPCRASQIWWTAPEIGGDLDPCLAEDNQGMGATLTVHPARGPMETHGLRVSPMVQDRRWPIDIGDGIDIGRI
jgi:hypothetical protein